MIEIIFARDKQQSSVVCGIELLPELFEKPVEDDMLECDSLYDSFNMLRSLEKPRFV